MANKVFGENKQPKFEQWVLQTAIHEWKNSGLSCRKIAKISGFTKSSVINYIADIIKKEHEPQKITAQNILSKPWSTWTCTSEKMDLPIKNTKQL